MLLGLAPRPDGWLATGAWRQRILAADRPRIQAQVGAMWKGMPRRFQYRIVGSTRAGTRWVEVFAIPLPAVPGGAGRRAIGFMRAANEDQVMRNAASRRLGSGWMSRASCTI